MKEIVENSNKNEFCPKLSPSVHKGHRERLRNQFCATDFADFPEHKILELMLTFVQPYRDVNPLAHNLIAEFGSLSNVLDASRDNLLKVKGVGEVTASFITFCAQMPQIYKMSKSRNKTCLFTPNQVVEYLKSTVDFSSTEKFFIICLNAKGEVLCFKSMGAGSVNKLYVNNRELVQQILKYPTHSAVICHTHPHGKPVPSQDDIDFTKEVFFLLKNIGIRLCDHVILSPDGHYSFFQHKLLGNASNQAEFGSLKMNLQDPGFSYFEDFFNHSGEQ
jgi:DNA repair protein RadC